MYTPGPKPPFDIRDIVPGSELDNDHLQARYDTVNRMVILVGDFTFARLFTEPWGTLLTGIDSRIMDAAAYGLLRPRTDLPGSDILSCFRYLREQHSELCGKAFILSGYRRRDVIRDQNLDRLFDVHVALWRQGVYLPNPLSCATNNEKQESAITRLLADAGSRTYRGYWERLMPNRPCDWSRDEILAVRGAMKAGALFDLAPNDRCCIEEEQICDEPAFGKTCYDCDFTDDKCENIKEKAGS